MKRPMIAVVLCAAVACVVATSVCASSLVPATAHVDIAYDIITRVIIAGTPPPPDSFAADADRLAKMPPAHYSTGAAPPGRAGGLVALLGLIPGVGSLIAMGATIAAAQAGNAAMKHEQEQHAAESRALMSAGGITRLAYYRSWQRVTTGQYTTITKPDQGLTVVLDSSKHTYTSQRTEPDIPTYTVDATSAPLSDVVGTPAFAVLPPATIEGKRVRGYRLTGVLQSTEAVGWCQTGRHDIDIVEYVADLPDPNNGPAKAPDPTSVLANACQPVTTASSFEPGKLVMFRSSSIHPGIAGDLAIVTELGNIRTTDQRDAALFSPPSDFTEEH